MASLSVDDATNTLSGSIASLRYLTCILGERLHSSSCGSNGRPSKSAAHCQSSGLGPGEARVEHGHLGWRAEARVLRADRTKLDRVPMASGHGGSPLAELEACPFEAVILLAEPACGGRPPEDVVLA